MVYENPDDLMDNTFKVLCVDNPLLGSMTEDEFDELCKEFEDLAQAA